MEDYTENELDEKYLEFLGDVERSFARLDISGSSMMARMYCGLRFTEGSIRALRLFKMMDGRDLLDEVGKSHLIDWLDSMSDDLKNS
jgi:hypothetical protein